MATQVIAFDVNETLLDLRPLDPVFEELFGDGSVRAEWFAQMLQVAFVGAITDSYVDFTTAQRAALYTQAPSRALRAGRRHFRWDIAGALAAGCRAAFVARPGMPRGPIGPQPDIAGGDLGEVAEIRGPDAVRAQASYQGSEPPARSLTVA